MEKAVTRQNLEFSSVPVGAWGVQPFKVLTILDMIAAPTWQFVDHTAAIEHFRGYLKDRRMSDKNVGRPSGAFTDDDKASLKVLLDNAMPWLEYLNLSASIDRVHRIEQIPEEGHDEYSITDILIQKLEVLLETITDELKRNVFLSLSFDDLKYYQQEELFGAEVFANFGSTRNDVAEAGNCYATGRYTACVFHCMRVVERGLHALVHELNSKHNAGLVFRDKVEYENWGSIITELQLALEHPKRLQRLSPLPTKDQMTFYSKVAIESEYFKNAWRDDVAHSRSHYDQHGARSVLDHVKVFMTYLAKQGLTE